MLGELIEAPSAEARVVEALCLQHDEEAEHFHPVTLRHHIRREDHCEQFAFNEDEIPLRPFDKISIPSSQLPVGCPFTPFTDGNEASLSSMFQMTTDRLLAHASAVGKGLLGDIRGMLVTIGVEQQLCQGHQFVYFQPFRG